MATPQEIPFEECVRAEVNGNTFVTAGESKVRITEFISAISGRANISEDDFVIEKELGRVSYYYNK